MYYVIKADIRELALDPSDQYFAAPLESDMFEWHFTIRGAEGTDFEGGIYHGRILVRRCAYLKSCLGLFLTITSRCLSYMIYVTSIN